MSEVCPAVVGCGAGEVAPRHGLLHKAVRRQRMGGSPSAPFVFVADDDAANRAALRSTLSAAGLCATMCDCAADLFDAFEASKPACLLLGLQAWGRDGLAVCDALAARQVNIPFIFLLHRHDVRNAVRAMRKGAVNVLATPFGDMELIGNVEDALRRDERLHRESSVRAEIALRLARLSDRERQILDLVVAGRGNKEIARALGIVRRTTGFHLANILRKMETETVAELVGMVVLHRSDAAVDIVLGDKSGYRVEA